MELPKVDLEQLRDLMKLMDQYDFDELDLRDERRRLHLLRNAGGRKTPPSVVMPAVVAPAPAVVGASAPAPIAGGAATLSGEAVGANIKVITSPMVGTFYRSPSPDSSSFVEEGQQVVEDTILCIIEAMKVMNEIKAECAGELVKILVANGEAVEYGEPLFHVRLSS
jgi:acetyl-CoA carboxylase biotin carboxyl carrier protein